MRTILVSFIFYSFFFQLSSASAEYRVFLLKISKKNQPPSTASAQNQEITTPPPTPNERIFESTLDPEQYRAYFPLAEDEVISYIETWRCYGRTDGVITFCPNPKRQPGSTDQPTSSQQAPSPETNSQNPINTSPSVP